MLLGCAQGSEGRRPYGNSSASRAASGHGVSLGQTRALRRVRTSARPLRRTPALPQRVRRWASPVAQWSRAPHARQPCSVHVHHRSSDAASKQDQTSANAARDRGRRPTAAAGILLTPVFQ